MEIISALDITNLKKTLKHEGIEIEKLHEDAIYHKLIIIICGQTCTGKTKLALNLARLFSTDVISADSLQVYQGMDIGTAKYNSIKSGIKQYMLDLFPPDHALTVVEFRERCRMVIENEFFKKRKIPIMAGGSGLYLRAVVDDLEFSSSLHGNVIKKEILESSPGNLYIRLQEIDPVYAAKISYNDKRRITRALDVYEKTGKPFSSFQKKWGERVSVYNTCFIGLLKDKQEMDDCILERTAKMFKDGLVKEVQYLVKEGYGDCRSLSQAVGYKETLKFLQGKITLEDCSYEIIKNTRKLAKKQMTWFKADPRINWIQLTNGQNIPDLIISTINIIWKEIENGKNKFFKI